MGKLYRTDSGHEMDEEDFKAYLEQCISDREKIGSCRGIAIIEIFEEDFFGDSIIDYKIWLRIKVQYIDEVKKSLEFLETIIHDKRTRTIYQCSW